MTLSRASRTLPARLRRAAPCVGADSPCGARGPRATAAPGIGWVDPVAASTRRPRRRTGLSRREYSLKLRCDSWGVPYSQVSRAAVFKRSGWLCALCGTPVDRRLRFPDPLSKSLDHVIPLSVPGSPGHIFGNCQLAHLGCNSRKGGVNRV